MARLWAPTTTYESICLGDYLPIMVKWETAGTEMTLPSLTAYITELLEKGFPPPSILAEDSRLEVKTLAPVPAEDTISLSGEVVDKRESGGKRLVECRVAVENQRGLRVAEATAVISL